MKVDNPSAFPSKEIDHNESAHQSRTVYHDQDRGMTLRDYFAGKTLNALLSNTNVRNATEEDRAEFCYLQADAMLKERAKTID